MKTTVDIRTVLVSQLRIDTAVQRHEPDMKRVAKLAEEWEDSLVGLLLVSVRDDGDMVVLDGAHRMLAARQRGITSLDAEVFFHLTTADEAALFGGRNDRLKVSPLDHWRVRRLRGDKTVLAIEAVLREHDAQIGYRPAEGYCCVGVLEELYRRRPQPFGQTIQLVERCWAQREEPRAARRAEVVAGVHLCVANYWLHPQWSLERALDKWPGPPPLLASRGRPSRLQDARNFGAIHGVSISVALADQLRGVYNIGLKKRLPPLQSWQELERVSRAPRPQ